MWRRSWRCSWRSHLRQARRLRWQRRDSLPGTCWRVRQHGRGGCGSTRQVLRSLRNTTAARQRRLGAAAAAYQAISEEGGVVGRARPLVSRRARALLRGAPHFISWLLLRARARSRPLASAWSLPSRRRGCGLRSLCAHYSGVITASPLRGWCCRDVQLADPFRPVAFIGRCAVQEELASKRRAGARRPGQSLCCLPAWG